MVREPLDILLCAPKFHDMLQYQTVMCLKRKLDREELKVLHLEVSDSIGYILSIQSCTALRCCYQAASVMEPLKANTTEMANIIEAGRSLCHFENPSVQIPTFLFATSMF